STTSMTSLTAATEELRSGLQTQLGAVLDSLDASASELGARTWPAKAVGEAAPGFELPDARGGSGTAPGRRREGPGRPAAHRGPHGGGAIDLTAFNGADSWELPAAGVFVVDTDGTIRYASVAGDYRWRVGPDEVLAALRA